jgi:hypothetical protein
MRHVSKLQQKGDFLMVRQVSVIVTEIICNRIERNNFSPASTKAKRLNQKLEELQQEMETSLSALVDFEITGMQQSGRIRG